MSTVEEITTGPYSLGRTAQEYERLRAQARFWEAATGRVLDAVAPAPGARCLDAGCGPGETMRLLAQRVGPSGRVIGLDVDGQLASATRAALHADGHRQCDVVVADLTQDAPVPQGPYDVVLARLLLFHLPSRVEVLARLWDAVAPGGHLVVQDYDLTTADVLAPAPGVRDAVRVMTLAFQAAGCDVRTGPGLPVLFAEAGVGTPDGTDVAGRLVPLRAGQEMIAVVVRSLLPAAIEHGVTTPDDAGAMFAALADDAERFGDRPMLWPLLVSAWKRKQP